jgi:apolipoprotein N-acyltransferase
MTNNPIKNIIQFIAIFVGVLVVSAIDSFTTSQLLILVGLAFAYIAYDFYKWNQEQEARCRAIAPLSEEVAREFSPYVRETIARIDREYR